jgi:hypothetical protein
VAARWTRTYSTKKAQLIKLCPFHTTTPHDGHQTVGKVVDCDVHIARLEHRRDVLQRDHGVNVTIVLVQQRVQAGVRRRLRVLINEHQTLKQVVVGIRWEVAAKHKLEGRGKH